jgi:hypothetical protein
MSECANTDVQDLLPEFVAESLGTSERFEVELHLAACAACRADVELLRVVRRARPVPAALNVTAIVAALPKAPNVTREPVLPVVTGQSPRVPPSMHNPRRAPQRSRPAAGWFTAGTMRMAAALTLVVLGGLSVAITRRDQLTTTESAVRSDAEFVMAQAFLPYADGVDPIAPIAPLAPAVLPIQELSEYSDDELALLLDQLDAWDGAPSIGLIDPSSPSASDSMIEGAS